MKKKTQPGQCPTCRSWVSSYHAPVKPPDASLPHPRCTDGWHETKKTRYVLGPYEDEAPVALMSLESAIDHLKAFFADQESGDEAHFRLIELTDAEVEAVPEL